MIRRRPQTAGSLAFIDVMACGLGAVLLLFVLLDFSPQPEIAPRDTVTDITDNSKFDMLTAENKSLELSLRDLSAEASELRAEIAANIISSIETKSIIPNVPLPIETPPAAKVQAYNGDLLGLQIKGSRILILLDTSASMSEERLIDVLVGVADESGNLRSNGPKWARAKRIAEWIISNGPDSSEYVLATYSDTTQLATGNWLPKAEILSELDIALAKIVPDGSTNLEAALEFTIQNLNGFDSVFVITDGLPTKANGRTRLLNTTSCGVGIPGRSNNVTGECRVALFNSSIKVFESLSSVVNIVLLPLEGDPLAAQLYWSWAASKRGRLFSPEVNWP